MAKIKYSHNLKGMARTRKMLRELDNMTVICGITDEMHPEHNLPANEIAILNIEGTERIPSRDFMYVAEGLIEDEVRRVAKDMVSKAYVTGKIRPEKVLEAVGKVQKQGIIDAIEMSDIYVPNAPETIRKKGFDKPLTESGKLKDFVEYQVIKGGGGGDD